MRLTKMTIRGRVEMTQEEHDAAMAERTVEKDRRDAAEAVRANVTPTQRTALINAEEKRLLTQMATENLQVQGLIE